MSKERSKTNGRVGETDVIELAATEADSPLTATDAVDEAEIRKIEELLKDSELAGGSIRLERKGPADTAYQYCTKIRVADGVDLDLIKRVWGGGDYKAKTFRSNGQMYKSFTFAIDYRIKGSLDMSAPASTSGGDESKLAVTLAQILKPDNNSNGMMIEMLKQSAASGEKTMQMMMLMMQQGQQQSTAMMTAMATAMAGKSSGGGIELIIPVLTAMISRPDRPAEKSGSLVELVAAMRELKELSVPGSVPQPEKEESVFDKILKYGGPVVAALVTRQPIQMPGQEQPTPEMAQLPAPSQAEPTNQLPPEFAMYVGMILGAAAKDADTGTYADLVADALDEQQAHILCGILKQPDWVEKLAQTDRRVLNFVPWFTKLRSDIFEIYAISDAPNQPDATRHAAQQPHVSGPSGHGSFITIPVAGQSAGPASDPAAS